jgi:5-hydroxyisourate hydrolase
VSLSTHVLDAVAGRPAPGVPVRLEQRTGDGWTLLAERVTDADGRIADLSTGLAAGGYRLVFDTGSYLGPAAFYPEVVVTFRAEGAGQHYHVPLLLSPYAYSTYRGS